MKVYEQELSAWKEKRSLLQARPLSSTQLEKINTKANELLKQTSENKGLHNLLGLSVILGLLILDAWVFTLKGNPGLFIMALAHGFILYSLTVYTMHEGAGHKRIILGWPKLAFLINNVNRLFWADPKLYSEIHPTHHQALGSSQDQAFTQMVLPSRILKSFLPGAGILPFNDYKIHAGDSWTKSKILTLIVGSLHSFFLFSIAKDNHSQLFLVILILIAAPWISFSLDRIRETTEHLLMKSNDLPEAREMGNNLWGYLIGGGPWGQPCHLSHHIAPALPWYQQLRLSNYIKSVLTENQRSHFYIEDGLLSFPKKFICLMKENSASFKERS